MFVEVMKAQNEALKTQNDIRRTTVEEFKATLPPVAAAVDPIQTLKAAKEILTPPTDNTMLTTIVTLLTTQINASAAEAKELRNEVKEMRNSQNGNGGFSVEKIVTAADKLLPLVERLWPAAKDGFNRVRPVRSNMSGWQEFLQPIIPSVVNSPIWGAIATGMMQSRQQAAPMMPQQQRPATVITASPQANGATADNPDPMLSFLDEIARPMLNHLAIDADPAEIGGEFAAWVYDGYSADPRYEQVLSTARMMGAQQVVNMFRSAPFWQQLAPIQAKFTTFLEGFLKWTPPADAEENAPVDAEVIDLGEQDARRSM